MGFLDNLSEKDEIKEQGKSPFAKKKKSDNKVVRIDKDKYESIRLEAFKNHTSIFEELNKIIDDGYKYRDEHSNK